MGNLEDKLPALNQRKMRPGTGIKGIPGAGSAKSASFAEAIEASAITLPVEGLIIFCFPRFLQIGRL